jgi:hypothetical protein
MLPILVALHLRLAAPVKPESDRRAFEIKDVSFGVENPTTSG